MKIIAIDGNEANVEKRVGVNVYAYQILCGLHKLQDTWQSQFSVVVFLKEKPLSDMPQETSSWRYRVLSPRGPMWILTKLTPTLWLTKLKPAVLFSPSHYTTPLAPCPTVCSIMDLGYLDSSDQFTKRTFWQLKYWTAISILRSKLILAISNATKEDIVRHYPSASEKTVVTHLGYDEGQFNVQVSDKDVRRVREKYHIVDDYILYLGTLKPSKNVAGIIDAFALICHSRPDRESIQRKHWTPDPSNMAGGQVRGDNRLKLVVAGKKGWMYEAIFATVKKLGLENGVIFTDYLPEADKPALMAGAKMLVSPSFWEGFGLHALEAMAVGTPVVVSDRGSFPEIVGDAGVLVNAESVTAIADGIRQILALNDKELAVLKQKMFLQVAKFTWEATAQKTLDAIRRVIDVQ